VVDLVKENIGRVWSVSYEGWQQSVARILDGCDLISNIPQDKTVLLKPNLVEAKIPPITTPVELISEIISYLRRKNPRLKIIVGEGVGAKEYDSWHAFEFLGYTEMARQLEVELIDLNEAELVKLKNKNCRRLPEIYLPKISLESFLLSVPVLKAHSLAGVTLTMKNMMGLAPPTHYQQGGHWKKASFHTQIQEAVLDLNRYRHADFTLMDATVGMAEAHLWGPTCEPPVNRLLAGFDPVAIDAHGTELLDRNWQDIGHLQMAHGELGQAVPLDVVEVKNG
jgi:uncharacterized protein (DUF362 family)